MRTVQDIQFEIASQTVYFDAPEGRPSSVTSVEVFRWDMPDNQTGETAVGAGSVESNPNTTLDAAAGSSAADPNNIPLTATTGVAVERTYLLTTAAGLREWAEIVSFVSADSARAKHPLHNVYASADTFQSTRIQATVDSTWVADETNLISEETGPNPMFRVRWVYVVSGVTYVADSYFNLVRYPAKHGVRPQDMEAFIPGWLDGLPTDHRNDQGRRLIDDAYRAVRIDMHQVDMAASSVAESEIVDELVRYKASELREWTRFMGNAANADQAHVDASAKRYISRLDSLIRVVSRVPVRDETGAATPVIAVGLTRR
jgi:hypothetical protein